MEVFRHVVRGGSLRRIIKNAKNTAGERFLFLSFARSFYCGHCINAGRAIARWDISLTLNMTYFLFVIARKRSDEAISREGEFPQSLYFFTLVVGYFACAQFDVRSPIVGFADTSPEGGSAVCFTVFAKECSDCGNLSE